MTKPQYPIATICFFLVSHDKYQNTAMSCDKFCPKLNIESDNKFQPNSLSSYALGASNT